VRSLLDALSLGLDFVLARHHSVRGGQLAAEQGEGEVVAVQLAKQIDFPARPVQTLLVDCLLDPCAGLGEGFAQRFLCRLVVRLKFQNAGIELVQVALSIPDCSNCFRSPGHGRNNSCDHGRELTSQAPRCRLAASRQDD
jgi:hypothetical protein